MANPYFLLGNVATLLQEYGIFFTVYVKGIKIIARGPNVARKVVPSGP